MPLPLPADTVRMIRRRWPEMSVEGGTQAARAADKIERGNYLLPRQITVTFHGAPDRPDISLTVRNEPTGLTMVTELRVTDLRGVSLETASLEGVTLLDLAAVALLPAMLVKVGPDTWEGVASHHPGGVTFDEDELLVALRAFRNTARAPRTLTEPFLQEVTDLYLRAQAEGRRPRKAVADHYGKHVQTVAVWLRKARDAGLLPPAGSED